MEKVVNGMVRNVGGQTVSTEVKRYFVDNGVQVEEREINQVQCKVQGKVFDMSFLYERKEASSTLLNDMRKLDVNSKSMKKLPPNRRNSIMGKNSEGSQLSISISSKKALQSRKRISQRISELSSMSKQEIDKDDDNELDENES